MTMIAFPDDDDSIFDDDDSIFDDDDSIFDDDDSGLMTMVVIYYDEWYWCELPKQFY